MQSLALLAERDAALCRLMLQALRNADYEVRACSNTLQLKADLYSTPVLAAECALLVLNTELVTHCLSDIAAVIRTRSVAREARTHVAFTCEFGALTLLPNLGDYHFVGLFEKPFDFDELERVARACRVRFGEPQFKPV